MNKVGVLVATSMDRSDFLIHRALPSILKQTYLPDCIVIVDDNPPIDFEKNKKKIEEINIETNLSTLNIFVLKHTYRFSLDIFIHLKKLDTNFG